VLILKGLVGSGGALVVCEDVGGWIVCVIGDEEEEE
jgi:hypothetical protein